MVFQNKNAFLRELKLQDIIPRVQTISKATGIPEKKISFFVIKKRFSKTIGKDV
jgi:hypothetical protein